MLLLLGVALLAPSINYATPNQNASDNFTNTTNCSEIVKNTTNSTIIQNTTTKVVNDTETNQKENQTAETIKNTQNSSSDYSNGTDNIQNYTAAASDGYQNVHGLWISADEASNVNLEEILTAGITDIFVKANRFSSPNYQSVLTSIISKFQGTGIRVHAWVTCFIDENGNWVDPLGKIYTYTVKVPYTETVKVATQNWYKDWYKVWYKAWYKSWYKSKGSWRYTWKSYWTYYWTYTWKYYTTYNYVTKTSYREETRTTTDTSFNDALVSYIADIAKNYRIDGVQLDYVRYPGTAYLHPGGTEAITNFVKKVDETLYSINPKIALSAALMPECSVNGYYYGQDYAALSPYLDFLVPMIYKGNYNQDTSWIGTTTKWISTHSTKPVVAGLQVYASDSNVKKLSATEVIQDIKSAISNGSSGYVLFRYGLVDKAFFNQASTIPSTNNSTSTSTTNSSSTNTNSQTTFTIAQIIDAAGRVKAFIENNKALPNYVTIGSLQVTMPQFLRLLTTSTLQVYSGISTPVVLKSASAASNPSEEMTSGNLDKNGYIDLANRIKSFMDTNGVAPNYGSTALGKIRYESLIYLYSRVMAFYGTEHYLPNYAVMKPWSSITGSSSTTNTVDPTIPSSLQVYLQATSNCQVNDPRIIALAQSITSGATSSYDKATRIFNWVRDNLEYSYYYDSQKGAVNALLSRSANCCDHSHLIVALSRAVGLPARYVHGVCTFSSGTYGHVWAQIYANGQWYNADATSYRNELGVIRNWNTNSWTYKGTYAELPF
ncbi:MAG: hypothetical protein HVN35_06690 [Methanobacteriaceae archaeon]|nr:hypothetical protein [Methanobacteriaceae archaeon]